MYYRAIVTRMYSMADEALQIAIEDTATLEIFKDRVFQALQVADHRAHVQMYRLFEDTNLTSELDYQELQAAKMAATLAYPLDGIPEKLDLGAGTAFEFSKNLASGEVLKIFLHNVDSYEDLNNAIKGAWDIVDSRLQKTNNRELRFMDYLKSLPFTIKLKIVKIMDILYGRNLKETVIEQLKGARISQEESEKTDVS